LFRAPDFTVAGNMLQGLVGLGNGLAPTVGIKPVLGVGMVAAVLVPSTQRVVEGWLVPKPYYAVTLALMLMACVWAVGEQKPIPFIYFQF
jgi:hypothetical protein